MFAYLLHIYKGTWSSCVHVCSFVVGSGSESPKAPGKLTILVFLWSPYPLGAYNHFSHSSTRLLKLLAIFGCESLHLFLLAAGCRLSGDSYSRLLSARNRALVIVSEIGSCSGDGLAHWPAETTPTSGKRACFIGSRLGAGLESGALHP